MKDCLQGPWKQLLNDALAPKVIRRDRSIFFVLDITTPDQCYDSYRGPNRTVFNFKDPAPLMDAGQAACLAAGEVFSGIYRASLDKLAMNSQMIRRQRTINRRRAESSNRECAATEKVHTQRRSAPRRQTPPAPSTVRL